MLNLAVCALIELLGHHTHRVGMHPLYIVLLSCGEGGKVATGGYPNIAAVQTLL